jgi:hypothetical protein
MNISHFLRLSVLLMRLRAEFCVNVAVLHGFGDLG